MLRLEKKREVLVPLRRLVSFRKETDISCIKWSNLSRCTMDSIPGSFEGSWRERGRERENLEKLVSILLPLLFLLLLFRCVEDFWCQFLARRIGRKLPVGKYSSLMRKVWLWISRLNCPFVFFDPILEMEKPLNDFPREIVLTAWKLCQGNRSSEEDSVSQLWYHRMKQRQNGIFFFFLNLKGAVSISYETKFSIRRYMRLKRNELVEFLILRSRAEIHIRPDLNEEISRFRDLRKEDLSLEELLFINSNNARNVCSLNM